MERQRPIEEDWHYDVDGNIDEAQDLYEALMNLVCCPAFNGELFEADKESHRAWTLAREALANVHR